MNDDLIRRSDLYKAYMSKGKDKLRLATVINELELTPAVGAVTRQWIPVTERLPDNDDFVLVVASGQAGNIRLDNAFELGQFSMSEGWILEMWPEWEDPKVTYWMPLPEPPNEVLQ